MSNFLDSPGGKDFLTELLSAHPVDREFLDRIPPDANSFSIFALDGLKVIHTLRDVLPDTMLKGFEDGLASMREDGVDLEKDVFEVSRAFTGWTVANTDYMALKMRNNTMRPYGYIAWQFKYDESDHA